MTRVEVAVGELLAEGLDDWVPVDRLIGKAREIAGQEGDFEVIAIDIVKFLIFQGLAIAGDIGESGFEEWSGTDPEIVERVINNCRSLEWGPFGAGCWFSNTALGDQWKG